MADTKIIDPWILKPEASEQTCLSKSSIERGVRQGWFPKPYKIGLRKIAWRQSQIDAYNRSRVSSATDLRPDPNQPS